MAKPIIIQAESKGYAPDSDPSSTERTYSNVVIPSSANTVIMLCVMDTSENDRIFTNLTYGNAAAIRTFLVDISSRSTRSTIGAIFDVSNAEALIGDVTATIDVQTSVPTRLGVVCSDGFVESFFTSNDRSSILGQSTVYSANYENNIFTLLSGADDIDQGFTYTDGIEIFTDSAGVGSIAVAAGYQPTNQADNTKKIQYTASTEEVTDLGVLLSSQKNPFQGGTFKIIDSLSDDAAFAAIFD